MIGEKIKEIRNKRGLSQQKLANQVGMSKTNLYRIEAGRHDTTISTLKKIAQALNVRIEDFFKGVKGIFINL